MEKINLQVKTIEMAVDNIAWESIVPQTVRVSEKDVYRFLRNYIYLHNDLANKFTEQIIEIRYTTGDSMNGNYVPCHNDTLSMYFDLMRSLQKE